MIKAVIFDLDGMIFEPRGYFSSEIEEKLNIPSEKVLEFFKNELGLCQRGKLDMKQVLEEKYFPAWGWTKGFEKFAAWWFDGETLNAKVIELVEELKKQDVVCILVSNNEKHRLSFVIEKFGLGRIFDYIILPYEVGAIKPEKKIFQAVLEKTGFEANEVVACDNEDKKLTGAGELGMKVLLAADEKALAEGLAKFCKKEDQLNKK